MKRLVILFAALVIAVWIGIGLHHQPGMMIISFAGWRLDAPLWLAGVVILLCYLLGHYTLRIVRGVLSSTHFMKNYPSSKRKQRANRATKKGLLLLAEGQWSKAEHLLLKGAAGSDMSWLNYVSAAKAAQELGATERGNHHLRHAYESIPDADIAIGLSQAQLQYRYGQYEPGLATLQELRIKAPTHPYVLKLLQQSYLKLHRWEELYTLLPTLKEHRALTREEFKKIEKISFKEYLQLAQKIEDLEKLQQIWQKIPAHLQQEPEIAIIYAKTLLKQQKFSEAEQVLRTALKMHWHEELVRLYGHLSGLDNDKLLAQAEKWLKMHPQSPGLLLTLGRLCEAEQLWGKAQRYLEASLSLEPHPQAYAQLGMLLEKMDQPALGAQFFKKGLLLVARKIKVKRAHND